MLKKLLEVITEPFGKVLDPRINRTKEYKLIDIIVIAICVIICGAEGWVGIELYGKNKQPWISRFRDCQTASLPFPWSVWVVLCIVDAQQFQLTFERNA